MSGIYDDTLNNTSGPSDQLVSDTAKTTLGVGKQSVSAVPAPWVWDYPKRSPANNNATFYAPIEIDGTRWDKLFPYRLLVIDTSNGNRIADSGGPAAANIQVSYGTSNTTVTFQKVDRWSFTLPITPEQLNIADQFAITTSATLKGVSEEHGAVPFKNITASGTMGVWPSRTSVVQPPASPSALASVFGGTLNAFGNLADQAKSVIASATSGNKNPKPVTPRPESTDAEINTTGYFQALSLQQFLEQYAIAKMDPKNSGWRLVLDIPKQNQALVVTPLVYNWKQDKNRPMEVQYSFQLKAWRRVNLEEVPATSSANPYTVGPGILQKVLNTITAARSVASSAINVISSVRSDVANVMNVLKQTSLLVKDLAGVVLTAADLPNQVCSDAHSTLFESLANVGLSKSSNDNPQVAQAITLMKGTLLKNEGLSQAAVQAGQIGATAAQSQAVDPINAIFNNPDANFDLFNTVPVYALSLSSAQQNAVDNAVIAARALTVADIKAFRATIQELAVQLSNAFGTGDAYYNEIYGRPAPSTSFQDITLDQYDILNTFYDCLAAYDSLTATTFLDDLNQQSNMDYVAGLANLAGMTFESTQAKVLAPVPFGLTVEAIALRYLGDPQRWLEIVTLNNLRPPYIDENGFQLRLLSNASGRQVTISDITNLYIGQRVVLRSSAQAPTARTILDIDRLSDTSYLLTLDGDANLDSYLLSNQAYLQAYLPGTVNSQQKIFIPSDLPVDEDLSITPAASTLSDPLTGVSKVDLLLTDTGDLAVNNYGDFRLASGMTNLIQALKIKFGTQQKQWLLHPDFGLGEKVGGKNSEIDVNALFSSINGMITRDPRFTTVENLQITLNGPTLNISLSVRIAGQKGVFPVNFSLN